MIIGHSIYQSIKFMWSLTKQFNFENQLVSLFPKINVVTENQVITVNQQTN